MNDYNTYLNKKFNLIEVIVFTKRSDTHNRREDSPLLRFVL